MYRPILLQWFQENELLFDICLNEDDIHLHVPSASQPNDDTSAGVTMATTLVSLISGNAIRPDIGMTGEITLRGQVLPGGGIKDKLLATHRSGLKTIILPAQNQADLEELSDQVRELLEFVFENTVDDILKAVFEPTSPSTVKKTSEEE